MYGTSAVVRTLTGLKFTDLGFASDVAFDTFLDARLAEITVLMNQDRNRTEIEVIAEGWKPAWDGIANRWATDFMHYVMASRDSPIVKVDDFQVETPRDNIPGPGVLSDLRRFKRKLDKRHVLETGVIRKPPETAV